MRKFFIVLSFLFICLYLSKDYFLRISIPDTVTEKAEKKYSKQVSHIEKVLYFFKEKLDPSFGKHNLIRASNLPIDVVIPIVEKDIETAKHTIKSIRDLVMHPIHKIYLVGPDKQALKDFSKEMGCVFLLENDVCENFEQIKVQGGWIIQQFIKLSMDIIVEQDHYLVVDADTVFLRPVVFESKGAYLINCHMDLSLSRKIFAKKILNISTCWKYDFVSHHMLKSKEILKSMKEHITKKEQAEWSQVLLEAAKADRNGFSEYELYMTYLTECTDEKHFFVSNANIGVYRDSISALESITKAYAGSYKSVSLHHFILRFPNKKISNSPESLAS